MIFSAITLFKLEKRNMWNIILDILCLSLGLLIGIVFLGQAGTAYKNYNEDKSYVPLTDYLICKTVMGTSLIQDDIVAIQEESKYIEEIQVFNSLNDEVVLYQEDFCPDIHIYTVTKNYEHIFKGEYMVGEGIKNAQNAVIGNEAAKRYSIEIGDRIEIGSHSFYICGILRVPQYSNHVMIWAEALDSQDFFDCQLFMRVNTQNQEMAETQDEIEEYLENRFGAFEVYTNSQYNEQKRERLQSGWLFSILVAVITLCYGLINIYNIETFFILKQKKSIAILRALGATQKNLLLAKLVRSFIIAVLAATLCSGMAALLEHTMFGNLIEFHVSVFVYSIAIILLAVVYAIFSFLLYRMHYRKQISGMMSDV